MKEINLQKSKKVPLHTLLFSSLNKILHVRLACIILPVEYFLPRIFFRKLYFYRIFYCRSSKKKPWKIAKIRTCKTVVSHGRWKNLTGLQFQFWNTQWFHWCNVGFHNHKCALNTRFDSNYITGQIALSLPSPNRCAWMEVGVAMKT